MDEVDPGRPGGFCEAETVSRESMLRILREVPARQHKLFVDQGSGEESQKERDQRNARSRAAHYVILYSRLVRLIAWSFIHDKAGPQRQQRAGHDACTPASLLQKRKDLQLVAQNPIQFVLVLFDHLLIVFDLLLVGQDLLLVFENLMLIRDYIRFCHCVRRS
jgi:hypothetical protein